MTPGVVTGTRLEQLEQLRARVDQEIALERVRAARGEPTTPPDPPGTAQASPAQAPLTPVPPSRESLVTLPVRDLPLKVIRTWAEDNGYSVGERGVIRDEVIHAFVDSHRLTKMDAKISRCSQCGDWVYATRPCGTCARGDLL